MVPADDFLLEISWDDDFIVNCVNNDIAECLWANSVPLGWAVDLMLDFDVMILFPFDERRFEWEVIVVIAIKFVDGIDFMDYFIWTAVKNFEPAEIIGSHVEFSSKMFKDCPVILVECDSLA